jgi:hypothetical protein
MRIVEGAREPIDQFAPLLHGVAVLTHHRNCKAVSAVVDKLRPDFSERADRIARSPGKGAGIRPSQTVSLRVGLDWSAELLICLQWMSEVILKPDIHPGRPTSVLRQKATFQSPATDVFGSM